MVNAAARTFNYKHCFIKTDTIEAGLGPANGGPLPACPLGVPTAITSHSGQSQQAGTTCTEIIDADEECVNNQLPIGKRMGRWTPNRNCNTFADDVLDRCTPCKVKPPSKPADSGKRYF